MAAGDRVANPYFVLHWADQSRTLSPLSGPSAPKVRMAVRVSRRFGSAPQRNRAKRIVREIFRREKPHFKSGTDFIVSIRSFQDRSNLNFNYLRGQFLSLCRDSSLYSGEVQ